MIGIVLIDDHAIFRDGLMARLERETDFTVRAGAATYDEAVRAVTKHQPDIAVTDLSLRGARGGLDLIETCSSRGDGTNFLALSMHDEDIYAERVLNAGGAGYLNKRASGDEVVDAIRAIHSGRILSPDVSSTLLGRLRFGQPSSNPNPVSKLSNRELAVFVAIGNRLNTKQIAADLKISTKTVDTHKERIRKKLGITDAYQLFIYAYEHLRAESNPPSTE